jgi:hypothetical protein
MSFRKNNEVYAGLFLVSAVTLMFEILICRIFSATVWYHFAFMAVSLSMFGMTLGALLVYLFPKVFSIEKTRLHLWLFTQFFAAFLVLSVLLYTTLPIVIEQSIAGAVSLSTIYILFSLPFVSGGIAVCLALTRFPEDVNRIYAADLVGAAVGCPAIVVLLGVVDPVAASLLMGIIASLAGVLFARNHLSSRYELAALTMILVLAGGFAIQNYARSTGHSGLVFRINKNTAIRPEDKFFEYEKWNAFSLIRVHPYTDLPFGWGLSTALPKSFRIEQKWLEIDGAAATVITKWLDDQGKLGYLKYDITNFAHMLRPDSNVMVIGVGGGRDILSALAFAQKSVVGAEINNTILNLLLNHFAEYSGNLGKNPKVTLVNDEARSYLAYSNRKFDIIQASLIDTWAASASGAYVLSENTLYTTDSWRSFLNHLTDRGILTFSRWYGSNDRPDECYRLIELGAQSLRLSGVKEPRKHLLAVCSNNHSVTQDVVTLLVGKQPFSSEDISRFQREAERLRFKVILSPLEASDTVVQNLTLPKRNTQFLSQYPGNIEAPTDDSPFFFLPEKPFSKNVWSGVDRQRNLGVFILDVLLICVTVLTLLCLIVPLTFTSRMIERRVALPLVSYFACVGLAFMLVEIATMQRLSVMLGHPTYGLTVVLFGLLTGTGLGSYVSGLWKSNTPAKRSMIAIILLLVLTALIASLLYWPQMFESAPLGVRIACSVACVLPMGLVMGTAFPLGIRLAESLGQRNLLPWLWGINGATSVFASVAAVMMTMSWGIQNTLLTGIGCYLIALLTLHFISRLKPADYPG